MMTTKEQQVMDKIYDELNTHNRAFEVARLLSDESLDVEELGNILETWSEGMKAKFHEASVTVDMLSTFLEDEELNDEMAGY
jgi:arsenate reductase-like glutaredoxin family protein